MPHDILIRHLSAVQRPVGGKGVVTLGNVTRGFKTLRGANNNYISKSLIKIVKFNQLRVVKTTITHIAVVFFYRTTFVLYSNMMLFIFSTISLKYRYVL